MQKYKSKINTFFAIFSKNYMCRMSSVLYLIKEYNNSKKNIQILTGLYKLFDIRLETLRICLNSLKKCSFFNKNKTKLIKEKIMFGMMIIKNSKGYHLKKSFRK